jgi:3-hydroxyisobutyrate dehydrogenase-like beta-hydroxyacid dehydrogenase
MGLSSTRSTCQQPDSRLVSGHEFQVMSRVGYIGLGNIGAPIAERLIEVAFDVSLWARRSDALDRFADTPATLCSSAVELARRCDIVGLCVLDDAAVLDVLDDDVMAALRPGAVVVIQSTVLPSTCRLIAAKGRPVASRSSTHRYRAEAPAPPEEN